MFNIVAKKFLFEPRSSNGGDALRLNKRCDLSHIDNYIHHLSNDGKKFLKSILNPDPKLRPTAAEALNHSWFKNMRAPIAAGLHFTKLQTNHVQRTQLLRKQVFNFEYP